MQILEQCVTQHILVGRRLHNDRNLGESRQLRRTPAPLAHDELVFAVHAPGETVCGMLLGLPALRLVNLLLRAFAHDNRLQHAHFLDRVGELLQFLLVERGARLVQIRSDLIRIELHQIAPGDRLELRRLALLFLRLRRVRQRGAVEEHVARVVGHG